MTWSEEAFWACSWDGFLDAWVGHRRFVLGLDSDDTPVSRVEAAALDAQFRLWQRTGFWDDPHG